MSRFWEISRPFRDLSSHSPDNRAVGIYLASALLDLALTLALALLSFATVLGLLSLTHARNKSRPRS